MYKKNIMTIIFFLLNRISVVPKNDMIYKYPELKLNETVCEQF